MLHCSKHFFLYSILFPVIHCNLSRSCSWIFEPRLASFNSTLLSLGFTAFSSRSCSYLIWLLNRKMLRAIPWLCHSVFIFVVEVFALLDSYYLNKTLVNTLLVTCHFYFKFRLEYFRSFADGILTETCLGKFSSDVTLF